MDPADQSMTNTRTLYRVCNMAYRLMSTHSIVVIPAELGFHCSLAAACSSVWEQSSHLASGYRKISCCLAYLPAQKQQLIKIKQLRSPNDCEDLSSRHVGSYDSEKLLPAGDKRSTRLYCVPIGGNVSYQGLF
jgi:hypothetical protein